MSMTDLDITKTWEARKKWTEAMVDGIVLELETWSNSVAKANLTQIILDAFPSGYDLDNDSLANMTNSLFEKQYETSQWAANVNIGTAADANWGDVLNANITFTPEFAGRYKATFQFVHFAASTNGNAMSLATQFRLTDSVNPGGYIRSGCVLSGGAGVDETFIVPVTVTHTFSLSASAQTIKLQKYNTVATNVQTNRIDCAADSYFLNMYVEKI